MSSFMRIFNRIPLSWRIVLTGALLGVVMFGTTIWIVADHKRHMILEMEQAELSSALALLKDAAGGGQERLVAEVRDGVLFINGNRMNDANEVVDRVRRSMGAVATIFLGDLRVATNVTRPDGSRGTGTRLAPGPAYDASITRGQTYVGQNEILGRMHLTIYEPLRDRDGRQIGLLFVGRPLGDIEAAVRQEILALLSYVVPILLIGLGILWFVLSSQLRPVRSITEGVEALARGESPDFSRWKDRSDEIGKLARAMTALAAEADTAYRLSQILEDTTQPIMVADPNDDFKITYANKATKELMQTIRGSMRRDVDPERMLGQSIDIFHEKPERIRKFLSDPKNLPHKARIRLGEEVLDLNVSAVKDRHGNYVAAALAWRVVSEQVRMTDRLEASVGKVAQDVMALVGNMTGAVRTLGDASGIAETATGKVSEAANAANRNVQAVASATEELSASIREISSQIATSTQIARQAATAAEDGAARIARLEEMAKGVGNVVRLINDIAGQTNLLALNATIEAARAGEAGKGFAVVASEVKNLAAQTAKATEEISAQITAMQSATGEVVQAMQSIRQVVEQINQSSTVISAAVEEQGAATQDIARSVSEVAHATDRTTSEIARIVEVSRSLRSEADSVGSVAAGLEQASRRLSTEMETFLQNARKAA